MCHISDGSNSVASINSLKTGTVRCNLFTRRDDSTVFFFSSSSFLRFEILLIIIVVVVVFLLLLLLFINYILLLTCRQNFQIVFHTLGFFWDVVCSCLYFKKKNI